MRNARVGSSAHVGKQAVERLREPEDGGRTRAIYGHATAHLDRSAETSLADQIRVGIGAVIESGLLAPGARSPSWLDLAARLGVARGTVRVAYEKLAAAQFVVVSHKAATRIADRPVRAPSWTRTRR